MAGAVSQKKISCSQDSRSAGALQGSEGQETHAGSLGRDTGTWYFTAQHYYTDSIHYIVYSIQYTVYSIQYTAGLPSGDQSLHLSVTT